MSNADMCSEPRLVIKSEAAEDRRSSKVLFFLDGEEILSTEIDARSMDGIISELIKAREKLDYSVEFAPILDKQYPSTFNPTWFIRPDQNNHFAVLWLRHPGSGWHAFGLPRHEAASVAQWLRKIPIFNSAQEKRESLPPDASSFGSDQFLLTSSGLGFYWYGSGPSTIGPNAFDQVEFDSDRAAGIVAGAIVETRLEHAMRSHFRPNVAIANNLFRPSGPLGPFSAKIEVAYMIKMITDEAHKDLVCLKSIRNDFAHNFDLDRFDVNSISDRCRNLKLVERHVGPIPSQAEDMLADRPIPYLGLCDYKQILLDPRFRYTMTAQILSYRLGSGASDTDHEFPII